MYLIQLLCKESSWCDSVHNVVLALLLKEKLIKAKPSLVGARRHCNMDLPMDAGTGGWLGLDTHPCLTLRLVQVGDGSKSFCEATGLLGRIFLGFHIVPPVLQLCQISGGKVPPMMAVFPLVCSFFESSVNAFGHTAGHGSVAGNSKPTGELCSVCDRGALLSPTIAPSFKESIHSGLTPSCASQQCHHSGCHEDRSWP